MNKDSASLGLKNWQMMAKDRVSLIRLRLGHWLIINKEEEKYKMLKNKVKIKL